MADWSSDSDDGDKINWETDGEAEPLSAFALSNLHAFGPSTLDANGWIHGEALSSSLVEEFVGKGFPKEIVLKAIKAIGNNDANAVHELLLTYKVLGVGNYSTSGYTQTSNMDWSSDSDDGDKIDWETDGEAEPLSALALSNLDASDPSTLHANRWTHGEALSSSLVEEFVGKGFPKEIVLKAIKAIGNNDANAVHELLLAYKVVGVGNYSTSCCAPHKVEDDNDDDLYFGIRDDDNDGEREANYEGSNIEIIDHPGLKMEVEVPID